MCSEGSEGSTGFPFWEMVFPYKKGAVKMKFHLSQPLVLAIDLS